MELRFDDSSHEYRLDGCRCKSVTGVAKIAIDDFSLQRYELATATETRGDVSTVAEWGKLPEDLDRQRGYVLLVPPGQPVGTLHEVDIEHGRDAARLALRIVAWRKELGYGCDIASEITPTVADRARAAADIDTLRRVWRDAKSANELTRDFLNVVEERRQQLLTANT